jgi:hydroxyacyl-ACP dehydratase HTD2-like protein with hotdog domain
MSLLTEEHLSCIGRQVGQATVQVTRRDIQKYSVATDQVQEKYLQGDEAPLMFVFNLFNDIQPMEQLGPDGIAIDRQAPVLPLKRVMAGGTRIRQDRPIRAGDELIGTRIIADLYEKAGRTGPLLFLVRELTVRTLAGEAVLQETQTRIYR